MSNEKTIREWVVEKVPDSLNWCTKYEGKPSWFRGSNNPAWLIYKQLFKPQTKCLMEVDPKTKEKTEICICCHDVWYNVRSVIYTLVAVIIAMLLMGFNLHVILKMLVMTGGIFVGMFIFQYGKALFKKWEY